MLQPSKRFPFKPIFCLHWFDYGQSRGRRSSENLAILWLQRDTKSAMQISHYRFEQLARLLGYTDLQNLQSAHKSWVEASLWVEPARESHWAESDAVGGKQSIEEVKKSLRFKAKSRSIAGSSDQYHLKKDISAFRSTSSAGIEP